MTVAALAKHTQAAVPHGAWRAALIGAMPHGLSDVRPSARGLELELETGMPAESSCLNTRNYENSQENTLIVLDSKFAEFF